MINLEGSWVGIAGIGDRDLQALRTPAERAILKAVLHLEGAVKKKLVGPRSGRVYKIGKAKGGRRSKTYQASAPGEPPALREGNLRKSITHTMPVWEGLDVWAEVGTNHPAGRVLEYGGITGRIGAQFRLLPRPYLAPAILEEEDRLTTILAEATRS